MFGKLWGGGSKKESAKDAILQLRMHLETLEKREQYFEQKRDEQDQVARALVTKDKNKAKAALRRRKHFEGELEKIQGQMVSIEQQLSAIESANLNHETMKVMAKGASAMKSIHGGMSIEKLDATMDDIRDQMVISEEISEAISRPLQEADDYDLEEDLELLEQEALDAKMIGAGQAPAAVPKAASKAAASPVTEEEDEEEVLRQLKEEMAM